MSSPSLQCQPRSPPSSHYHCSRSITLQIPSSSRRLLPSQQVAPQIFPKSPFPHFPDHYHSGGLQPPSSPPWMWACNNICHPNRSLRRDLIASNHRACLCYSSSSSASVFASVSSAATVDRHPHGLCPYPSPPADPFFQVSDPGFLAPPSSPWTWACNDICHPNMALGRGLSATSDLRPCLCATAAATVVVVMDCNEVEKRIIAMRIGKQQRRAATAATARRFSFSSEPEILTVVPSTARTTGSFPLFPSAFPAKQLSVTPPGTPLGTTPPGSPTGNTPPGTPPGTTPPGTSPGTIPPGSPTGNTPPGTPPRPIPSSPAQQPSSTPPRNPPRPIIPPPPRSPFPPSAAVSNPPASSSTTTTSSTATAAAAAEPRTSTKRHKRSDYTVVELRRPRSLADRIRRASRAGQPLLPILSDPANIWVEPCPDEEEEDTTTCAEEEPGAGALYDDDGDALLYHDGETTPCTVLRNSVEAASLSAEVESFGSFVARTPSLPSSSFSVPAVCPWAQAHGTKKKLPAGLRIVDPRLAVVDGRRRRRRRMRASHLLLLPLLSLLTTTTTTTMTMSVAEALAMASLEPVLRVGLGEVFQYRVHVPGLGPETETGLGRRGGRRGRRELGFGVGLEVGMLNV